LARDSDRWPRYVPVGERKLAARRTAAAVNRGGELQPINITGRAIATTFWGKSWCQHLEKFSDFSNRLPRGRTYARNGSIVHLEIDSGRVSAIVAGSDTYHISINIKPLPEEKWQTLKQQCAGGIDSALELLQGKLSGSVMRTVCDRDNGLFPSPSEIQLDCDCPDWAALCKHLAAVMYGVGARLDESPELLFKLRGVDYQELIGAELAIDTSSTATELEGDLTDIFGIEIDSSFDLDGGLPMAKPKRPGPSRKAKTTGSKPRKKKIAAKSATTRQQPTGGSINITRGIRASHIVKLRKLHELSQQDLATLTGKSIATIRNWESRTGVLKLQLNSKQALQDIFAMSSKKIVLALKRLS